MGTSWHVTYVAAPGLPDADALSSGIAAQLAAVDTSMSTYRPDSELSRVSAAGTGDWLAVTPAFARVLATALQVGSASEGAYDVTVAPLVDLWGFGPAGPANGVPEAARVREVRAGVGQDAVELNAGGTAVRKHAPRSLDFSSLAKGYAVDQVADWLAAQGVHRYLVEVGGEMRLAGLSARGDRWRIAIEQPESALRAVAAAISVTDIAMATSGDYRNYFEANGRRYSHSIDPRTGYPVAHDLVSVTVLHPSAMVADAWATALTVLGAERGAAVAEAQGLAVYFIRRAGDGFEHSHTPAFTPYLAGDEPDATGGEHP